MKAGPAALMTWSFSLALTTTAFGQAKPVACVRLSPARQAPPPPNFDPRKGKLATLPPAPVGCDLYSGFSDADVANACKPSPVTKVEPAGCPTAELHGRCTMPKNAKGAFVVQHYYSVPELEANFKKVAAMNAENGCKAAKGTWAKP